MKQKKPKKNNKGFTLIELLVVISIIGLFSSIVLAGLQNARQRAQNTKIVAEINQLKTALELYKNDNGKYTAEDTYYFYSTYSSPTAVAFLTTQLVTNKYISSIPNTGLQSVLYSNYLGEYDWYFTCGGKILTSYIFAFSYSQNLNLPKDGYYLGGIYYPNHSPFLGANAHMYCIGE